MIKVNKIVNIDQATFLPIVKFEIKFPTNLDMIEQKDPILFEKLTIALQLLEEYSTNE